MQEDKHKYKAQTLKLTNMLERTLKELAAIKKEHQRSVEELNGAQRSRDQIIQILKKQVAHEVQQRERLENENAQLYGKLAQLDYTPASSSRLRSSQKSGDSNDQQPQKSVAASMNRTINQLRLEVESLKLEKEDARLKVEYESTIEYNKLRNELKITQQKLMGLEAQVRTLEASRTRLQSDNAKLEEFIDDMKANPAAKLQASNNEQVDDARVDAMTMELDRLQQECRFLKSANDELQASTTQYQNIIGEYRASLDEARLKYDNRQLQFIREKNNDRVQRDLLRAELEKQRQIDLQRIDYIKDTEEKLEKTNEYEKKIGQLQIRNSELIDKIEELLQVQRSDYSENVQNLQQDHNSKLAQKDRIIEEYKTQCDRLAEINQRLSQDINKIEGEQTRMRTSRAAKERIFQEQLHILSSENSGLKKEKQFHEIKTKQELTRLHQEVEQMVGADQADLEMIENLRNEKARLQADIQKLTQSLSEAETSLSNARAEKIRLSTQFQEAASQANSYRMKSEKFGRELEGYITRERTNNKIIEQMKGEMDYLEEKTAEMENQLEKYKAAYEEHTKRIEQVKEESLLDSKDQSLIDIPVLKIENQKLIEINNVLNQQKAEIEEELNKKREEIEELQKQQKAIIEELQKIKESSEQLKIEMAVEQSNSVSRNIEAQRNVSQMSLQLHSLKQQNNQLLRERNDYLQQSQQKQALITTLQMKLSYIESSLQSLQHQHQSHEQEATLTSKELEQTKIKFQVLTKTLEQQKIKCSSLEKVVVQKSREIKRLEEERSASEGKIQESSLLIMKMKEEASMYQRQIQLLKMEKQVAQKQEEAMEKLKTEIEKLTQKIHKLEDKQRQQNIVILLKQTELQQSLRTIKVESSQKSEIEAKCRKLEDSNKQIQGLLHGCESRLSNKQKQLTQIKQILQEKVLKVRKLEEDLFKQQLESKQLISLEIHQTKIKALNEEIRSTKDRLAVQSENYSNIELANQELKISLNNLQMKCKQIALDLGAKQSQKRNLTQQLSEVVKTQQELESKLVIYQTQVETLNERRNSLQSQNIKLSKSLDQLPELSNKFQNLQRIHVDTVEYNKRLLEKENQLVQKLQKQKSDNDELKIKYQEFIQKCDELTKASRKWQRQIDELKNQNEQISKDLTKKQTQSKQIEQQLKSEAVESAEKINKLKQQLGKLALSKQESENKYNKLLEQNTQIIKESSQTHQILNAMSQLRTQNQKLQIQICNMYSQETVEQIKNNYQTELDKQRQNYLEVSKSVLEAQTASKQLKIDLEILASQKTKVEKQHQSILLQNKTKSKEAIQMQNKIETQLSTQLNKVKKELQSAISNHQQELNLIKNQKDELQRKLEENVKEATKQQMLNKEINAKVQVYQKQLRTKDEVTRKWFNDKEKALTSLSVENERYRVEISKNEGGAHSSDIQQLRHIIENLRNQLDKKVKNESKLVSQRKQLKEEVFFVKREIENLKDDLNFERKRNNHLEELYSKYRSVKYITSDQSIDFPKSKPSAKVQPSSISSIEAPPQLEGLNPPSKVSGKE